MSEDNKGSEGTGGEHVEVPPLAAAPTVALREDQIQNAVSFLSHPKVQASPAATKRSFLERKGLTAAEIDEAFRRAPAPDTVTSTATPVLSQQGSGLVTYVPQNSQLQSAAQQPAQQMQQQVPQQQMQLATKPAALAPQPVPQPPAPEPVRWTQVLLGLGVVAVGAYAVHSVVTPFMTGVYHKWMAAARARQEEQERHKRETEEAVEALRSMQAQLVAASESMAQAAKTLQEQVASAATSRNELRELTEAVRSLKSSGVQPDRGAGHFQGVQYDHDRYDDTSYYDYVSGRREMRPPGGWLGSGGSPGGAAAKPAWAGGSKGGAGPGAMSAYQITGYDDGGFSAYADYAGTAAGAQQQRAPEQQRQSGPAPASPAAVPAGLPAPAASAGVDAAAASAKAAGPEPTYPRSFQEVMDMVSKGVTPPNVRTDINDKPPDPTRAPSAPKVQPRPKPWERSGNAADGTAPAVAEPGRPDAVPTAADAGSSPQYPQVPAWGTAAAAAAAAFSQSPASFMAEQVPPSQPTLSVLQPLANSGSTWQPPALPEPTIGSLARGKAAASSTSVASAPAAVSQLEPEAVAAPGEQAQTSSAVVEEAAPVEQADQP